LTQEQAQHQATETARARTHSGISDLGRERNDSFEMEILGSCPSLRIVAAILPPKRIKIRHECAKSHSA
jgi:hypothetical protein